MTNVKRVDVSKLSVEQRAALGQFIRDAKSAEPYIREVQDTAQEVFQAWLRSAQWSIVEGDNPEDAKPSKLWNIGAPQVNYVDHIEGAR
jgi:hypothetical protein